MKCFSIFCLVIFTGFSPTAAQQTALTLQQCIDSALARNLQIQQRNVDVQTAATNLAQARANRLPFINGGIDHGIQQGRSIDPFTNGYVNQQINYAGYALGGDLTLFNGLSLKNNARQFSFAAEAARMDEQQQRDVTTLNVILAYLQVLNNEDLAAISRTQVAVTQQQVNRLEILNREGAISPPLLYDLRGQLKGEEVNVVTALNAVETAKLNLLQLMNMPYDPGTVLVRDGSESTLQQYGFTAAAVYDQAVSQLALVKAVGLRTQSAQAAVQATRGLLFPTISLAGNLNSNYSSVARTENLVGTADMPTSAYVVLNGTKTQVLAPQKNYVSQKIVYTDQLRNNIASNVGLVLRVPLLNGLQTRNRIRLAQLNVKRLQLTEADTRLQLHQAIDQAYLNMKNAWARYTVLQEQVAAYSEAFRAAEVRFNAGAGTSVDYILAKGRVDNANLNVVVAKYDYILRTKVLDYYRGNQ